MKPLISNNNEVKDSFEFKEFILGQQVSSENECMISFDVTSLFPNIPLNETIELCEQLWTETETMTKEALVELLRFSTKDLSFLFNDKWYKQKDGVAMGSPLAPTLASIFMQSFENIIDQFTGSKPLVYKRYVDDIFLIFEKEDQVKPFLDYMNGIHPNIKFTMEFEQQNKISFLDVLIKRVNHERYQTEVFRKKTDIGVYTARNSFSMVKGLIHRV